MTKRKTKAEREAEQKEALLQRITDICAGACGRAMDDDEAMLSVEELPRLRAAVRDVFGEAETKRFVFGDWSIGDWENPTKLTELLFRNGWRSDEVWVEEEADG